MDNLPQWRCPKCNRLLFYGHVRHISIKCPKCGRIHDIVADEISGGQGSKECDGNEYKNG